MVGVLTGRYYDVNGEPTEETHKVGFQKEKREIERGLL